MKKTKNTPVKQFKGLGAKARKLKSQKVKSADVLDEPVVDKFIDEDTKLDADDVQVSHPTDWDIRDEVSQMDSYKDYLQESRGNSLSYGDY